MKLKESKFKMTLKSPLLFATYRAFVELNTAGTDWETICWSYAHGGECF